MWDNGAGLMGQDAAAFGDLARERHSHSSVALHETASEVSKSAVADALARFHVARERELGIDVPSRGLSR